MSSTRVDNTPATVSVDQTRTRQTPAAATPFKDVLAGGANALLTGAAVAGGAIGGPAVAAAIQQARVSVGDATSGGGGGVGGGGVAGTGIGGGADAALNASSGNGEFAALHAMNVESQQFNVQMLKLQEETQNENRRFTTLSNLLRAKADLNKNILNNVRS